MQYCSFQHRTFTFATRHIHNLVLFLLWLSLFIPSGAISPLFSSSILGIYHPGEFNFHCHIFLPFHSVHGVLKARMLKWLPFHPPVHHIWSELSTMTCPSWVALHGMAHSFIELDKAVIPVISWLVFCDCGFHSVCLLIIPPCQESPQEKVHRTRIYASMHAESVFI